jgi:MoxR-like ATPase
MTTTTTSTTPNPLHAKVTQIRDALEASLAEREEAVEVLLTAFVCQEHLVYEGPPGTAKSLVADALMQCIEGDYVRRLLHKFMVADELIGPMDLAAFQAERVFKRVLKNGAADCHGLFLDEIFKSNGALLNTLLTLLEERQFSDGSGSVTVPLRMCVSASNEFPQEEVLAALYDRFLFRYRVRYIEHRSNKRRLLVAKASQAKKAQKFVPPCKITVDEWDTVAAEVDTVTIPDALVDKLLDFSDSLSKDGMVMSDRRSVKVLRAIKASAWLDGETSASVDHLQVLRYCAWDTPEEQIKVEAACQSLEKSGTRDCLDAIDSALRAFRSMPLDPEARTASLGTTVAAIKKAGEYVKGKYQGGELSARGKAKIERRMVELREAYRALESEIRI